MKKQCTLWLILPFILFAASGCYRAPEFPVEPEISFNSLNFYDVPSGQDSLVVTINFQDGDGDLGLSGNLDEADPPYHPFYFVTIDNRLVESPGNNTLLRIGSNDTMPPYNCVDYRIGRVHPQSKMYYPYCTEKYQDLFFEEGKACGMDPDTLYVKPNIYAYNFLVDFMVKKDGRYEAFDWNAKAPNRCGEVFDGKFPIIFDIDTPGKPLSGELTYRLESAGFIPYFRNDTLKLRIQIIDRALHMSNIIETPDFYFVEQNGQYVIEMAGG